jgi:hypothetical protein
VFVQTIRWFAIALLLSLAWRTIVTAQGEVPGPQPPRGQLTITTGAFPGRVSKGIATR